MLTQVVPRLAALRKQGHAGQAKITQYTRYVTVGLGLLYAVVYVQAARTWRRHSQVAAAAPRSIR